MILDSSVLVAILWDEPEASRFSMMIEQQSSIRISAASYLESAIVIDRARDPWVSSRVDAVLRQADARIEPVTEQQVRIARAAYRDFGRGSGHPAQLNFGDCFSYALAKVTGEPLLYKGRDFAFTDVTSGLPL